MNSNKIRYWSITVALAGFLFGFDTVVISGANQPIKELWNTTPFFHGTFIMSMALWGTVIGALFGGIPSDKFGRKKTLFWIGVLYFASAIGSALAPDPYTFSFFRFIGGLGVGASSVAAPTYISEISSANNRGKLVALYQFMIVFGILIAFISNYALAGVGGTNDWRYMLGIEGLPALAYSVMVLGVSESPRWLALKKKDHAAALQVLQSVDPATAQHKLREIEEDIEPQGQHAGLFSKKYSRPIMLAFLIAFFNQLSGINFILYYAPELLEKAGFAGSESLSSSISIGGINLIFTMLGMFLIDKLGRRQLMYIGSFGYLIGLSGTAICFMQGSSPTVLLSFILVFIASHAIGQGAVIWVFISEVFPNQVRAFGQSFGSFIHWIFAAIITLITPIFIDKDQGIFGDNPWPVFAFFAFMMFLQLLFVWRIMPETKGKTLEELEKELIRE
ncbi:sugar porter family MFS transporter [Roseivirga pacifica]|uniref:sugar porter family MFS transporter n=1 Tax=Roseivirga pacifica TaxID=1267423 RepID=UPI002095A086|nr:sugar porter family MFS transporter [Roseivirga pacifica]MCO6360919.1 sugar porter family MFS transporter [Roseivirga pacifica]MCO6368808.1 sugar porter family MFS transporter [Roseivirga pacifica]MCO6372952.1 sugar porter family MFS transporter [Roseivirga pacifica]MCO6377012.1 sugar porter family MFS transporter [Roseivirga pacifica]MCO6377711.1 sugar porter family MFS transporter [Roseivirga pacifica]